MHVFVDAHKVLHGQLRSIRVDAQQRAQYPAVTFAKVLQHFLCCRGGACALAHATAKGLHAEGEGVAQGAVHVEYDCFVHVPNEGDVRK